MGYLRFEELSRELEEVLIDALYAVDSTWRDNYETVIEAAEDLIPDWQSKYADEDTEYTHELDFS